MKHFLKTLPTRHVIVTSLIKKHGQEAFMWLSSLLELAQEIGSFELTLDVLSSTCNIKNPRLSRVFDDVNNAFIQAQVALGILNEVEISESESNSNEDTSTKFNSNELSSTSEGQNTDGRNNSITREDRVDSNKKEKKSDKFKLEN